MTHVNLNNPDPTLEAAIARVSQSGERIFLQVNGRVVAALVPADEAQYLENIEDEIDIAETRKALDEVSREGTLPWEEVKKDLGL